MSVLILPGRGARGQRPSGPPVLNRDSVQARALLRWHPLIGNSIQERARGFATSSTAVTWTGTPLGVVSAYASTPSYVNVGANADIISASQLSVSAWVLTNTTASSSGGGGLRYISGDEQGGSGAYLIRYAPSAGKFEAYAQVSGFGYVGGSGATTVAANTVYHVAFVWNAGSIKLYVNGVEDGSWSTAGTALGSTAQDIYIGTSTQFTDRQWSGWITDHRIARCAWSPTEVGAFYATPWDLYWVPGRTLYFDTAAAPAATSRPIFRQPARAFRRSF